jgi:hypothetical protein
VTTSGRPCEPPRLDLAHGQFIDAGAQSATPAFRGSLLTSRSGCSWLASVPRTGPSPSSSLDRPACWMEMSADRTTRFVLPSLPARPRALGPRRAGRKPRPPCSAGCANSRGDGSPGIGDGLRSDRGRSAARGGVRSTVTRTSPTTLSSAPLPVAFAEVPASTPAQIPEFVDLAGLAGSIGVRDHPIALLVGNALLEGDLSAVG